MRFPAEFESRLKGFFPRYSDQILHNLYRSKGVVSFRVNRIKGRGRDVISSLKSLGFNLKQLAWYEDGFILINRSLRDLQQTTAYLEGLIYVQNPSSMLPPLFMDLERGQKVLDLCAAPGSKTSQIASLLENGCELVAVEKIRPRFYKLKANLERQAVQAELRLMDGVRVGRVYPAYFDRILLDAPCSAEGRFDINNPRSFKYWSLRKVKEMQKKQKRLFRAAYYALKQSGIMVYSTCTFSPEENEFLIKWALEKFDGLSVVDRDIGLKNAFPGMDGLGWHIIPNDEMEGFYICVLRKG